MTFESVNSRPSWSHDGKWIYFASNRTGRAEVWKAPAGGGSAVQLTRNGGSDPMESVDGTALYYNSGNRIMKAGVDGSGETRLIGNEATTFFVTREGICYVTMPPDGALRFFSFATKTSRLLLKTDKLEWSWIGVSPDSRWLLYTQIDGQPGSDLMLVENFH